ncbi:hypothetical protein BG005_008134 [Podila minutissima]|nr:hypothetical protein BG005_008134 [Podila minutissima]
MSKVTKVVELVCADMDRQNLLKCALVNKQWHKAVMPFIFKDIPELITQRQQDSFRQLVLDDYDLKEGRRLEKQHRKQRDKRQKQRKKEQEQRSLQLEQPEKTTREPVPGSAVPSMVKESTGGTDPEVFKPPMTLLAKFGCSVRTIPDVGRILFWLLDPQLKSPPTYHIKTSNAPSALDLLEHFLSRCRNLQLPGVHLNRYVFQNSALFRLAVKYCVPAAVSLTISDLQSDEDEDNDNKSDDCSCHSEDYVTDESSTDDQYDTDDDIKADKLRNHTASSVALKYILMQTSIHLRSLSIDIGASWVTKKIYPSGELASGRSDFMSGIKELRTIRCGNKHDRVVLKCWTWIWKHTGTLRTVDLADTSPSFFLSMIGAIKNQMRQLQEIRIGSDVEDLHYNKALFKDAAIATILKAGPSFTAIYLGMSARAGIHTARVLPCHYAFLTEFAMDISAGDDSFLVGIPAFSMNLRKFITLRGEQPNAAHDQFPRISAETFADVDSCTKAYRAWACEATLETLHVRIVDIAAEPDVCGMDDGGNEHDGQEDPESVA